MQAKSLLTRFLIFTAFVAPATAQTAPISHYGASENAAFGKVVERIGDVDADGTRDFAVGAPYSDEVIHIPFPVFIENAGAVSIYSGVNGELIWKVAGPLSGDTEFGFAVADAGDVDLDGHDDVLVGLPNANGVVPESGSVQLLSGLDGTPIRSFLGTQTDERYGESICAGHMDPDLSSAEVAIGAPHHDTGGFTGGPLQEGRVEVRDLSSGVVRAALFGNPFFVTGALFTDEYVRRSWGMQLAYVGDHDSNGYGSIVIAAPFSDFIDNHLLGSTTHAMSGFVMMTEALNPAPNALDSAWTRGAAGDLLGFRLDALDDDLNGDGDVDWVAFAQGPSELHCYSGEIQSLFTASGSCIVGATSIASIGDYDDNGVADLAVGVEGLSSATGHVCLISGLDGSQIDQLVGPENGGRYGSGVAGADMDGDGKPEIWIGSSSDDTNYTNGGAVYVDSESTCFEPASWDTYGEGTPGTNGVPTLAPFSNPVMGQNIGIQISSVTEFETLAALLIGVQQVQVPILGGTMLTLPFLIMPLSLPQIGDVAILGVPDAPGLCGVDVYLQSVQENPDAPGGWAFSHGLRLSLGGY